jgi:hypothetical protein
MDDEEESTRSSVRLPSFLQWHAKDFMIWWVRFRAFATVHRFVLALGDTDEADLPLREDAVLVATADADKPRVAARKRNAVAMANCSMAFTNESNLGMIFKAIAAERPAGKASTVTGLLQARCVPQDAMTRVQLRQELNKIKMKKHEDAASLFEQIGSVTNRHRSPTGANGANVIEEDMTAIILDAAPAEHQAVLTSEQRAKGTTLARAHLEEAMNKHWRQIKSKKINREDKGEEANLSAITCHKCHETSHKANKCPQRRPSSWKRARRKRRRSRRMRSRTRTGQWTLQWQLQSLR